ncbi:MAG: hypothetical protein IIA45_14215, partial [Bacteroidetes bacterium]|nr:hypothetical protein [Bacteroidota bacterium]
MKTAITCFISLLILQCSAADGAPLRTSELFHLDEQFIANELKELTLLEEYVNENEGLTYCKIIEMKNSSLYEPGCNFPLENLSNDIFNELPMGIPAFFWGFTG